MITPIKENVLIKPFPSDEQTAGGLFIPESCREISNKATVVEAGKGTKEKPMQFSPGDIVFRVKDVGDEIIIDGEKHFLVKQSWLIAREN
jgi:chaperonin GroES